MFDIGALEFLVLGIAALFIFGPDRLPEMARKAAQGLRQLRGMAANARRDLTRELGPEFDDFDIRDLNPRQFVRKHVLDGLDEDDLRVDRDLDIRDDLRVDLDAEPTTYSNGSSSTTVNGSDQADTDAELNDSDSTTATLTRKPPPFDTDAT
ncbi:sec-independent translocase [Flindersiella endophytica]